MGGKKIRKFAVKSWINQYDRSQKSIAFDCNNMLVVKITCKLCTDFKKEVKFFRNFSTSVINSVTGAA